MFSPKMVSNLGRLTVCFARRLCNYWKPCIVWGFVTIIWKLCNTHFIFNDCPIYTDDGASAKFSINSHETVYSEGALWKQNTP